MYMLYQCPVLYNCMSVSPPGLAYLQGLNLERIVMCQLNPLKVCLPAVTNMFAAITRYRGTPTNHPFSQSHINYTLLQHCVSFCLLLKM